MPGPVRITAPPDRHQGAQASEPTAREAQPNPPDEPLPHGVSAPVITRAGHAGPGPQARDKKVRSQSGFTHPGSRRVADLQDQTAQLERQLSDARMSLERELAQLAEGRQ